MNITTSIALLHYLSRNTRMKAAMYVLLVAVLVLIVEMFIWSIAKFKNIEVHNDVVDQRNLLYKQTRIQELNSHLQQTIPIVESIERKYKSAPGQSDVMKQLSGLIRDHRLRLNSQSVAVMSNENDTSSINSIELMVSGRYVDIRAMLGKLRTINAWVEVSDIKLERVDESQISAQIRLLLIKESAQ